MKKMHKLINNYKTKNDYEIDKIISKQIMYHLQTFLKNK
jgi:predicted amidophosphoribosyltransferase